MVQYYCAGVSGISQAQEVYGQTGRPSQGCKPGVLAVEASKDPDRFGSGFLEVEVLRSTVGSSLEVSKH